MADDAHAPGRSNPVADTFLGPLLARVHIDFVLADPQPSWGRLAVATVVALTGSLAADAVLAAAGKAVFPGTKHFAHFAFSSYARLTVVGVLIACAAWPVVTRVSPRPRWVFLRAALAVTVVLLLPDAYIWLKGESARGILVLVGMHLAIAMVTYNALVRIASAGEAPPTAGDGASGG